MEIIKNNLNKMHYFCIPVGTHLYHSNDSLFQIKPSLKEKLKNILNR